MKTQEQLAVKWSLLQKGTPRNELKAGITDSEKWCLTGTRQSFLLDGRTALKEVQVSVGKKTVLTVFILGIWVFTWFYFSVNVVEVCRWGVKERWRTRMSAKPFPTKWSATSSSWAGKWGGDILRNGGICLQPSKPLLENENKAGSPRKKRLPWLSPDR